MSRPSSPVRWSVLALVLGGAVLSACGSSDPFTGETNPFQLIRVVVLSEGQGMGSVVSDEPAVAINCEFTGSTVLSTCQDEFEDAGAGGIFTLTAVPGTMTRFAGWSGCSSTAGQVCTLTFSAGADTGFRVMANFQPDEQAGLNLLNNGGFEVNVGVGPLPAVTGMWQGDLVDRLATGRGVGTALRFLATGSTGGAVGLFSSQQWQLVDLSAYATEIDAGQVEAHASVWFNRNMFNGPAEEDNRFDLRVLPFPGTPAGFPGAYATATNIAAASILTDADSDTWEEATVTTLLPVGTRYVAVEIYAFENVSDDATQEFKASFADDASFSISIGP